MHLAGSRRGWQRLAGLVLLAAACPAAADPPAELRVALASSPKQFADFGKWLEKTYRVRCVPIEADKAKGVPDAKHLDEADVLLLNLYRTEPADEDLKRFQAYFAAGKPVVGMRKASHAFQNWLEVDQVVFGVKYGGHFLLNKKDLVNEVEPAAKDDPLVTGHVPSLPGGGLYSYTKLAPDVTVLIRGGEPGNLMPQTFYRVNKERGGQRAFYTRYDPKDLATKPEVKELVVRALFWAADRDEAKFRR
jgi:type 1 glutamine amidotransferase